MRKLFFVLSLALTVSAFSQEKQKFLFAYLSDKSVSLYPSYKIFGSHFDPAITAGGGIDYFSRQSATIFQVLEGTLFSQSLTGTGLSLSTSIGMRKEVPAGVYSEIMIGLGGAGFISGRENYSLNDEGSYEKVTPLHWTLGVPIDLGIGYRFEKLALYCKYRYMIEGPYTDIMPVLPTSLISIGIKVGFNRTVNE